MDWLVGLQLDLVGLLFSRVEHDLWSGIAEAFGCFLDACCGSRCVVGRDGVGLHLERGAAPLFLRVARSRTCCDGSGSGRGAVGGRGGGRGRICTERAEVVGHCLLDAGLRLSTPLGSLEPLAEEPIRRQQQRREGRHQDHREAREIAERGHQPAREPRAEGALVRFLDDAAVAEVEEHAEHHAHDQQPRESADRSLEDARDEPDERPRKHQQEEHHARRPAEGVVEPREGDLQQALGLELDPVEVVVEQRRDREQRDPSEEERPQPVRDGARAARDRRARHF